MRLTNYRYELREGGTITATGHLTHAIELAVGDEIEIGRNRGIVRELGPRAANGETRLVIQLRSRSSLSAD